MKRIGLVLLVLVVLVGGLAAQPFRIFNNGTIDFVPSGTTFTLRAQDSGSGIASIFYQVNGGPILEYSEPLVFEEDGRYAVVYYSIDQMGNASIPQIINFIIDGTAPAGSVTTRGESLLVDDVLHVRSNTGIVVHAHDAGGSGLQNVFFSLDGTNFLRYDYEAFINEQGRHTVYIYGVDNVGNRSEVFQFPVVVDNTPPDVRIVAMQPLEAIQGERYSVDGNSFIVRATDNVSGVRRIEVSIDRREFFTYLEPIVVTETGFRSIRARAIDNLGNISPITELTFYLDGQKPVVSSVTSHAEITLPE